MNYATSSRFVWIADPVTDEPVVLRVVDYHSCRQAPIENGELHNSAELIRKPTFRKGERYVAQGFVCRLSTPHDSYRRRRFAPSQPADRCPTSSDIP